MNGSEIIRSSFYRKFKGLYLFGFIYLAVYPFIANTNTLRQVINIRVANGDDLKMWTEAANAVNK
jgi:hypothetical protein